VESADFVDADWTGTEPMTVVTSAGKQLGGMNNRWRLRTSGETEENYNLCQDMWPLHPKFEAVISGIRHER
jgi:hypothetical protein